MRSLALFALLAGVAAGQDKPNGHAVRFQPGDAKSPHSPRFSPYGTPVKLAAAELPKLAGKDHLTGRIPLGPPATRGDGQRIAIARSEAGKPYDLLVLDTNLDGSLDDEKAITTKPNVTREKWWSSFDGPLKVNHAAKGADPQLADYPVSFWTVVEKPGDTPDVIRYSRRGFSTGTVTIDGTEYIVGISDGNNDGVIGVGDYWAIARVKGEGPLSQQQGWRKMPDFAWGGGKAWKLELTGTDGAAGKLFAFDPGVTQVADEEKRDMYKPDRDAPRAEKPVPFERDFETALKAAAAAKQRCYVQFEAEWCGSCKIMDVLVFKAKDVAAAAEGIVCVVVDGDKRKDLAEKYKVGSYPAGVLLDADGTEVARASGYQSVKMMAAFFTKHKK